MRMEEKTGIEKTNFAEKIVLFAFIFTTFSGAIRKWSTASSSVNNAILFIQLLIPWLIFISIYDKSRSSKLFVVLLVYLTYLFLCAFNPLNATIYHGILGIILHGGFWFALFAYLDNRDKIDAVKLSPWFLAVCLVQFGLGVVQYLLPSEHFLNKYVSLEQVKAIAKVGSAVRVTGTFSYIGGYSSFVIFVALYAWSIAIQKTFQSRLVLLLLFLAFAGALMNGSRSTAAILLVFSCLIFFNRRFILHSISSIFLLFFLVLGLFFYSPKVQNFATRTYENFMSRVTENRASGEEKTRVLGPIDRIIHFRGKYTFGIGLGATYQGANAIWGESWYAKDYGFYEDEAERIILEGGYPLFFFRVVLLFVLGYYIKIPFYAFAFFYFLILLFFPIVFNIYNSIYMLFGLFLLDRAFSKAKLNR